MHPAVWLGLALGAFWSNGGVCLFPNGFDPRSGDDGVGDGPIRKPAHGFLLAPD